jgi:hypothetical protein
MILLKSIVFGDTVLYSWGSMIIPSSFRLVEWLESGKAICFNPSFPTSPLHLKVGTPSIIAPVPLTAPSQRLILGPADLARLGVDVALELGRRAAEQALVDGLDGGRGC